MTIKANSNIDTNGFSLAHTLDGMKMQDVLAHFPNAQMEGYEDDEKGYDGVEAGFSTPDGNFYLYSRWGHLMLGCLDGHHNPKSKTWATELRKIMQI